MEMTQAQRQEFAQRIQRKRILDYGDNKKAAYNAAGINSGTWARLEQGQRVAPRTVYVVCKSLWPETGGDWRQLVPPLAGEDAVSQLTDRELAALRDIIGEADVDDALRRRLLGAVEQQERGAS